jgi:membrane protein YqaA with SNARE-associated domain
MAVKKYFKLTKKNLIIFIFILFFILWSIVLIKVSPIKITETIGIQNSYLLTFFVAFLGGSSILIPFPYYLFIITFGAGGLNPFLLGIIGGLGLALGDSITYFIGYKGKEVLPHKVQKIFNKIRIICSKRSWLMPFFLFIYGAIIPIPNDLIILPLGLGRYPYWKMAIPLTIGNMIYTTGLALLGYYGLVVLF